MLHAPRPHGALRSYTCHCSSLFEACADSRGCHAAQPFNLEIAKVWFPANCIFVGMLWTSFLPLQLLTVGMVSVLKNITNLFTIAGDIALYGKTYGTGARQRPEPWYKPCSRALGRASEPSLSTLACLTRLHREF